MDVGAAALLLLEGRDGATGVGEVVSLFVFCELLEEAAGAALLEDFLAEEALVAAAEGLEEEDAAEGFLEKKENKFFWPLACAMLLFVFAMIALLLILLSIIEVTQESVSCRKCGWLDKYALSKTMG